MLDLVNEAVGDPLRVSPGHARPHPVAQVVHGALALGHDLPGVVVLELIEAKVHPLGEGAAVLQPVWAVGVELA